jgi:hypothetical protein
MREARLNQRKKLPRSTLASFLAVCMLLLAVQPGMSWGKRLCASGSKAASEIGTGVNLHKMVAQGCCCCPVDAKPCDCDLTTEGNSSPIDLAPSWSPVRQSLTYYGHTTPPQECMADSSDSRPPSASFTFARAPSPTIYLLTLNLIC